VNVLDRLEYSCTVRDARRTIALCATGAAWPTSIGNQQSSISNGWAPPNTRESRREAQRGRCGLVIDRVQLPAETGTRIEEIGWGPIEKPRTQAGSALLASQRAKNFGNSRTVLFLAAQRALSRANAVRPKGIPPDQA
jgi:hypothetical protein